MHYFKFLSVVFFKLLRFYLPYCNFPLCQDSLCLNLKEWSAWELRVGLRLRSCELWPQLRKSKKFAQSHKLLVSENFAKVRIFASENSIHFCLSIFHPVNKKFIFLILLSQVHVKCQNLNKYTEQNEVIISF